MEFLRNFLVVLAVLAMIRTAKSYKEETVEESGEPLIRSEGSAANTTGEGSKEKEFPLIPVEERPRVIKIKTIDGKPDWKELAKVIGKIRAMKLQKQSENAHRARNVSKSDVKDASGTQPGTNRFSVLIAKLRAFNSPIKTQVENKLTSLCKEWSSLDDETRSGVGGVLDTVIGNIDKFADAGDNPIGAVQGALNIVGSVSGLFGPVGQLVSIGLSFISGLLGLFGKGPKPKPLSQVVREQVEKALTEYRFETLTDKANGLTNVYQRSIAYLEGPLGSSSPITTQIINIVACRVQLDQGDHFVDELGVIIGKYHKKNDPADAKKCIAASEIYANLAGLKDMILTQMLTLSTGVVAVDAAGLIASLKTHRGIAKGVLEPLYTVKTDSKILPYFDPDISVVTDTYAKGVLGLGNHDRSLSGLYCLSTNVNNARQDLVWSTSINEIYVQGRPYLTIATPSNQNCYWKLVHHGNNIYSIINRKGCTDNQQAVNCGDALSFSVLHGGRAFADLKSTNGILWEIQGGSNKRIRSKWPCAGGSSDPYSKYCNRELLVSPRYYMYFDDHLRFEYPVEVNVGQVQPSDGSYPWTLRRRQ